MKIDIFKYSNYKEYLVERLDNDSKVTKALRARLCAHIGCQQSYLSQVINGKPHLTLEQSVLLNSFFTHDKTESRYFILLVEIGRAGSRELKSYFTEQASEIRNERLNFKKRFADSDEIPSEQQHQYYSAWFYSAIHVALSIKDYQDVQTLADRFNLPATLVSEALHFLEDIGLIESSKGRWHFTKRRIHLQRNSKFIQRHHINWRSQCLQSVEKNLPEDLHYSNVIAISREDYQKIRGLLAESVERTRAIIGPSPEEDIYALTLDFFRL